MPMDHWPVVGRVEERAYLAEVIDDPAMRGVLVAGRAGVGKTRLMHEVVESAGGHRVEVVTATESARALPFGAVAHLLPEDLGSIDRIDLLAVIGREVTCRAEGRPVVFAVDDMHLLDTFSAALVHHIVTARIATVILTLRSGEPAPDAVAGLYRDGLISRLELQPISRSEFDRLIEEALGAPIEGVTLDRMWGFTQGNVLFARQLIEDACEAGTFARDRGVWRWTGGLGVAPRLQETIAARLATLTDQERQFVELLAIGEPLPFECVERLAPRVSVTNLERRDLIAAETIDHRTLLRLAHPLFGETLRASMPETLRRQLHHDLAEDLTAVEQPRCDVLRLVLLREAAGEVADPGLLVLAAQNANVLSDHRMAERLARGAVSGGEGFGAQLELGRALYGQNRLEEAEAVLVSLVGAEPSDADRECLADMIAQTVGFGLDRVDEALQLLESMEVSVGDVVAKALLRAQRASLLAHGARFAEAADLGAAAMKSVGDEGVRLRSLSSVGGSLMMAGRIDEALALSEEAIEPALRLQDRFPRAPTWVISLRAHSFFLAGRAQEALDLIDFAVGAIPNLPPHQVARANVYRGRYLLFQGRVNSALRLLNDAALTLRDASGSEPSWCLALASEAHALLGHQGEARVAAMEASGLRRSSILAYHADELRAAAWVDAQDGHLSSAVDQLWHAADLATSQGQRSLEIIVLDDLLRLGEYGAAQRVREVSEHVDGRWSKAIATHAVAVTCTDAVSFEKAAEAFGSIGSQLVASELWASASEARRREGLPARAAGAARHSVELVERCEGAKTQSLASGTAPVSLSRRERETAMLAATGKTNAEIAAELSVSIRTIESHLYAAFAKLGIADRKHLLNALKGE